MDVITEIKAAREDGVVHCGVSSRESPSLAEVAQEFGLAPDERLYQEINAQEALKLLGLILHQDMAYSSEIIPYSDACRMAGQFLDLFSSSDSRYFTNGTFHKPTGKRFGNASWNPVTDSTFDTGVLILGPSGSGCLWVEDED